MSSNLMGGIFSLVVSKFGIMGGVVLVGGYLLFSHFASSGDDAAPAADQTAAKSDKRVQFVSFVLDDVQKTWAQKLSEKNLDYQKAKLVIFQGATNTACGYGQSATGPFYCPNDQHVYLDLSFFRTLEGKLGAQGDFAEAYVIGHEVGHHVQNLLGLTDKIHAANPRAAKGANGLSVQVELQADCFAGIWAHETARRDLLEGGDLEEALRAAAAIGDDRLQKMSEGTVQPESWTHGSSAQRVEWFKRGYASGEIDSCDTSKLAVR